MHQSAVLAVNLPIGRHHERLTVDYLSVTNLDQYQHYKKKNPLWIKFYRTFWTDHALLQVSPMDRLLFLGCCTLASELDNKIPNDPRYLSSRLNMKITPKMIQTLLSSSLLCLFSSLTYTKPRETLETVYKPSRVSLESNEKKRLTPLASEVAKVADKYFPPV
jgi:hypothetical protein